MIHNPQSTLIEEVMEALSEYDSEGIARALSIILNAAMQVERQMTEVKRRIQVGMVFPKERSLLRLVNAILMEVDE